MRISLGKDEMQRDDGDKCAHENAEPPALAQKQDEREDEIEHHLIAKRPTLYDDGMQRIVLQDRQEEQRAGEIRHTEEMAVEELRLEQDPRRGQQRDDPVERHDAGDAAAHETPGIGWPARRRHPHDEAADDEENVDAGGSDIERTAELLADMEANHRACGEAAQILDAMYACHDALTRLASCCGALTPRRIAQ